MTLALRDIEYFVAIAERGNVGRAAESLGLSQPALSKSLRRLEVSMQTKLVKKVPKGVELTAVGSAFLAHVRRIRLSLDDVAHEVADLTQGRAGQVRVGTNQHAIDHVLPAMCGALLKDAPKLKLKVTVGSNDVLVPALRNGQLDLIISGIPMSPEGDLVQVQLSDDEFVVYASANHRLAKLKRVTIADLSRERWALLPDVLATQWLRRTLEDNGLPPPEIALETSSEALRLHAVASSELLGFTSRISVLEAAPRLRLVVLHVKELTWRRPLGARYRKDAYLSPAARRFIELLIVTAKKIADEKVVQ
jgi:DNA-binding transcriptional LysR family regulator